MYLNIDIYIYIHITCYRTWAIRAYQFIVV